jgi:hypothetical protein
MQKHSSAARKAARVGGLRSIGTFAHTRFASVQLLNSNLTKFSRNRRAAVDKISLLAIRQQRILHLLLDRRDLKPDFVIPSQGIIGHDNSPHLRSDSADRNYKRDCIESSLARDKRSGAYRRRVPRRREVPVT